MDDIDKMQSGFMQGCGAISTLFILKQLQEKYLAKKKNLQFSFPDLEKTFDRVPKDLRELDAEQRSVKVLQSPYRNSQSLARVNKNYGDGFVVTKGQRELRNEVWFRIPVECLVRFVPGIFRF